MILRRRHRVVDGIYIGDTTPSRRVEPIPPGARGMFFDPAQIPTTLMEPSMEAGQSAAPEGAVVKPSVGRVVHYVSHGTPPQADGTRAYCSECRAAIITEVPEGVAAPQTLGLCVLNPTGQFFNRSVPYGEAGRSGDPDCRYSDMHGGSAFISCSCGWAERKLVGGTWHWPERTDG